MAGRHHLRRSVRRRLARRQAVSGAVSSSEQDAWRAEQARRVQANRRGWVVMWSVWHRTFTAFGCFSPESLVLDESTIAELAEQMLRAELRYDATHP
jgi:hypothetical protein